MNDSKNLILAVVLSALVLLGWTYAANTYFPTASPQSTKVEKGKQVSASAATGAARPFDPEGAPKPGRGPRLRHASRSGRPRCADRSTSRARRSTICCWSARRQTIDKNSPPVRLLSPLGAPGAYIAQFGWTAEGGQAPDLNTVWTADSNVLTPGRPVTLNTQTPDGVHYQIKISVDDGYLFTIKQSAANASGKPFVVRPIGLVSRADKAHDPDSWTNHVGPLTSSAGPPTMASITRRWTKAAKAFRTSAAGSASPTNIG